MLLRPSADEITDQTVGLAAGFHFAIAAAGRRNGCGPPLLLAVDHHPLEHVKVAVTLVANAPAREAEVAFLFTNGEVF